MNIDHMAYYPINIEESGPPLDGDVVMVSGGIAQYRGGEWFSGMEIPPFQRPITWEVTHYMPIPIFGPNEITEDPYEVVINHTDPGEIKAALALAEKKLARAEKLNKVMYDALVLIASDRNSPPILAGTWEKTSKKWQTAWNLATNIAKSTIELLTDRQLEDVLMPDKGGEPDVS